MSGAGIEAIRARLRLPVIQAPMFLVTGPAMVIAACRAGIVGCFPTQNVRSLEELERWFAEIDAATLAPDGGRAPWAVNVIVHDSYARRDSDVEMLLKYRPPLVVTALGSPRSIIEAIHSYGGIVFADVISVKFARKALDAGADGLVLVAAGAGGHTGPVSGFALVEEVRRFFAGPIALGGGIGTGRAVRAAEILGADFAYMGTRFIATEESMVSRAQKDMVVAAGSADIVCSDSFTGVKANWLRQSIVDAGLDPDNLPPGHIDFSRQDQKRWRDLWSAGQGVAAVERVCPLAEVVEQLEREYHAAGGPAPERARAAPGSEAAPPTSDELTGLASEALFLQSLRYECARAQEGRIRELSLLLIEIDEFAAIAARHGAAARDLVLESAGRLLRRVTRRSDVAARLGEARFGLLLPNAGARNAGQIATNLRHRINAELVRAGTAALQYSACIGHVAWSVDDADEQALLARCGMALRRARGEGQGRVCAG